MIDLLPPRTADHHGPAHLALGANSALMAHKQRGSGRQVTRRPFQLVTNWFDQQPQQAGGTLQKSNIVATSGRGDLQGTEPPTEVHADMEGATCEQSTSVSHTHIAVDEASRRRTQRHREGSGRRTHLRSFNLTVTLPAPPPPETPQPSPQPLTPTPSAAALLALLPPPTSGMGLKPLLTSVPRSRGPRFGRTPVEGIPEKLPMSVFKTPGARPSPSALSYSWPTPCEGLLERPLLLTSKKARPNLPPLPPKPVLDTPIEGVPEKGLPFRRMTPAAALMAARAAQTPAPSSPSQQKQPESAQHEAGEGAHAVGASLQGAGEPAEQCEVGVQTGASLRSLHVAFRTPASAAPPHAEDRLEGAADVQHMSSSPAGGSQRVLGQELDDCDDPAPLHNDDNIAPSPSDDVEPMQLDLQLHDQQQPGKDEEQQQQEVEHDVHAAGPSRKRHAAQGEEVEEAWAGLYKDDHGPGMYGDDEHGELLDGGHLESADAAAKREARRKSAAAARVRKSEAHRELTAVRGRKSLSGAGMLLDEDQGVRRSSRSRIRPLEYWRNEHKLYGRDHKSLPTVVGVETRTPNPQWPALSTGHVTKKTKPRTKQAAK